MFNARQTHRRHRFDAAATRVPRPHSRRLAIEVMESRLLLSGQTAGGLDYEIWNLDSIQDNYALISQGSPLPAPPSSTSSTSGPAGAQIDVAWVLVPNLALSASDARSLSYLHYRDAMSQGLIDFQQASSLFQQWQAGFAHDPSLPNVPIYAIGIRPPYVDAAPTASDSDILGGTPTNGGGLLNPSPIFTNVGSNHGTSTSGLIGQLTSSSTVGYTDYFSESIVRSVETGLLLSGQRDSLSDHLLDSSYDGSFTLFSVVGSSLSPLVEFNAGTIGKFVGDLASVDGDLYSAVYNSDSVGLRRFTISLAQDTGNVFTYVLGGTGEDAAFQAAGSNGESLYVASEGGEVSIAQLVGTAKPMSGSAESAPQFAASSASAEVPQRFQPDKAAALAAADISGELARAVIFEVIDGQAVPIVYAASDGDGGYMVTGQYIASAAESGRQRTIVPLDGSTTTAVVDRAATRLAAGARIAAAAIRPATARHALFVNPAVHARLEELADSSLPLAPSEASWGRQADGLPMTGVGAADVARSEAFSHWDDTDADSPQRAGVSHAWLAATPLLAVLAAERLAARKLKQSRREPASPRPLRLNRK